MDHLATGFYRIHQRFSLWIPGNRVLTHSPAILPGGTMSPSPPDKAPTITNTVGITLWIVPAHYRVTSPLSVPTPSFKSFRTFCSRTHRHLTPLIVPPPVINVFSDGSSPRLMISSEQAPPKLKIVYPHFGAHLYTPDYHSLSPFHESKRIFTTLLTSLRRRGNCL